jgi:hypothetical protein
MTNKTNLLAKKLRPQLISLFGGKCEVCGITEKLQFAHVRKTGLKGRGRGRKERLWDIMNHPLDYKLTCRSHNSIVEEIINV